MTNFNWNREEVSTEVNALLETLSVEYLVKEGTSCGMLLNFIKQDKGLEVTFSDGCAEIRYNSISTAARGIGKVLGELSQDSLPVDLDFIEEAPFSTFGILIDCSRNATIKVEFFKKYLCQLALMGYNMAMLYTKDAYELPGEDFFGYLRGRYSIPDLQEIDAYAATLGIEMIGSIQALGHLEPTLQWPAYRQVKDTPSVILTSEEKSYTLLRKMLEFWSTAFKSRRIHLGMDETHDLGRGVYMDKNGYRRGYDIFNDHLKKVTADCTDLGLKPIIWSDMYFRMGSKTGDYYDETSVIPPDIKYDIPESVELNYWDYYHENEAFYREWIRRHREDLGFEPLMASGIWSWDAFWHNHQQTVDTAVPCIDACIKEGIKDFFFTVWADDGAFCNLESILAGACSMAEKVFSLSHEMNETAVEKRFNAICRSDYTAHKQMSAMTVRNNKCSRKGIDARGILWDDPLLQIYRKNQLGGNSDWSKDTINHFREIATQVADVPDTDRGCFGYGKTLLTMLITKLELMDQLDAAYQAKDAALLETVAGKLPELIAEYDLFITMFRSYQYERFNPQGFEILQIRLGGQKERIREVVLRIGELLAGEIFVIPELEEKASHPDVCRTYNMLASASYFI